MPSHSYTVNPPVHSITFPSRLPLGQSSPRFVPNPIHTFSSPTPISCWHTHCSPDSSHSFSMRYITHQVVIKVTCASFYSFPSQLRDVPLPTTAFSSLCLCKWLIFAAYIMLHITVNKSQCKSHCNMQSSELWQTSIETLLACNSPDPESLWGFKNFMFLFGIIQTAEISPQSCDRVGKKISK